MKMGKRTVKRAGYAFDIFLLHCMADAYYMQFGNVNQQVFNVSQQLSDISELEQGFDAIGFSQGMCCTTDVLPAVHDAYQEGNSCERMLNGITVLRCII